ncbi:hypothetical protein ABZ816_29685 [Actinosynnema sp. NPDC047251]|uniref:hypothetical protein n=1 Tax=Saccharothrix espanaensis TaxID=103731 RepID=UPI00059BAD40|nr:hypothetical protein [Saccharothrix espanaensis]
MDETLRAAVLRRLSQLEEVAERGAAEALVPLARAEINRLADGWRLLLTVHQPHSDGRCRACPGVLRHKKWPCQVWTMAHQHLIGEGLPHRERRRPLRGPFGRMRDAETSTEATTEIPAVVSKPRHALPD